MKKATSILLAGAILTGAAGTTVVHPIPAFAGQVQTGELGKTIKVNIKIYSAKNPSSGYTVGQLAQGELLAIRSRDAKWAEILYKSKRAYVLLQDIQLVKPAEERGTYLLHNSVNAQFYDAPNLSAATANGAAPQILNASRKLGNWYYISTWLGGKWVYNDAHQLEERKIETLKAEAFLKTSQQQAVYNGPFLYTKTASLLPQQIVAVYRRSGSWYEVQTNSGKKWMYDTKASFVTGVDLSKAEQLGAVRFRFTRAVSAYTLPVSYGTGEVLQPGIVTVSRQLGTWYEVNTPAGKRWIDASGAGSMTKETPIDWAPVQTLGKAALYVGQAVRAFMQPSDFYITEEVLAPGTLYASRKLNNWYEVDTPKGKRWVRAADASPYYVSGKIEDSIGKLPLTKQVMLHNGPFQELATTQALAPQVVRTLARTAGWIQIDTAAGPKWIPDAEGFTADTSTYQWVTASSRGTTKDYAVAYGKYADSQEDKYLVKDGVVMEMQRGFVRAAGPNATVSVYDPQTKQALTYFAKGTDLGFVKTDGNYIYVSYEGKTALLKRAEAQLIPDLTGQPQSYFERAGNLLYRRVYEASSGQYSSYSMGPAPAQLTAGKRYYTYDRTQIGGMDSYEYFNYLPLRVKSSYTAQELNDYINLAYPATLRALYPIPPLLGKAQTFIDTANRYNMNASYLLAHAIHESAWGTSRIAREKNNLFGFRAVDSDPYGGATSFSTFEAGLDYCAKYINDTYFNTSDWRYAGAILGDKARGMNVRYASDSDWGSEIAAYMYRMDAMYGNRDRNRYQLAVMNAGVKQYNASFGVASTVSMPTFAAIRATVTNVQGTFYEITSNNPSSVKLYVRTADVKLIRAY
ncbi:N-acetylglucosaminidase [Ectobacillus ponti]|uniref:Glucosaminidase domain-containing protein n=1 Tax=Ectobacillus ponti TaxID=2961894 RepID=A0AA41X4Z1_9BACI|nr:glucosaminidase domain-containing protein [Ectobacillus ponti]MCP8967278.1 glucosaminidase domain-containing protein [Ectobacillus ponti]